jgi:S-adenosylmethionine-dependent methyltransferase
MTSDVSFDGIADAFEMEIYGSSKGDIRLSVLWEDMLANMPRLADGGLRVLDAGGGAGHVTTRLAALGNKVVLADPSREMLDRAQTAIDNADLSSQVSVVHAPIQHLGSLLDQRFDVIVCHAVLEWLADPHGALDELVSLLELDGELSLLFYNRNARLLKLILAGAFEDALREHDPEPSPRGSQRGAVPLAEEAVRAWMTELGLGVRSKAAIRIFHDHLTPDMRSPERLGELLSVEKALRSQEPFASLGQHIHLVCAAPGATTGGAEKA